MVRRYKQGRHPLKLPEVATRLRYALGWTQAKMAVELGVRVDYWSHCEAGRRLFSIPMLDRVREVTGIDLYVLGYCLNCDSRKLPGRLPQLLKELGLEWERQIEIMHRIKQTLPGWQ